MAVDAQLRVVREVRTELQEERPEIVVDRVEVEVVHHRRRRDQPRIGGAGGRVVAALGAQHARLLLRLADVEHALAPGPVAQVLLRTVVLALAPTERHDVDAVAFGVALDRVDEPLRDRRHQHRRRHCGAPHLAEEIRCPRRPLQHRHVDVLRAERGELGVHDEPHNRGLAPEERQPEQAGLADATLARRSEDRRRGQVARSDLHVDESTGAASRTESVRSIVALELSANECRRCAEGTETRSRSSPKRWTATRDRSR